MTFKWPEGSLEDLLSDTTKLLVENGYGYLAAAFAGYQIELMPRRSGRAGGIASVNPEQRIVRLSELSIELGYYFALGALCHEATHLGDPPMNSSRTLARLGLRKIAKVLAEGERVADRVGIECLLARRLLLISRGESTTGVDAAVAELRAHSESQNDDRMEIFLRKKPGVEGVARIQGQIAEQCRELVFTQKIADARLLWQALESALKDGNSVDAEFLVIAIDLSK